MDLGSVIVVLASIGSVTGIVAMLIDKRFGGRDKRLEAERLLIEQQLAMQAQRLIELERHNDQLEQALAWHRRLAEAQGEPARSLGGLGDVEHALRAPIGR